MRVPKCIQDYKHLHRYCIQLYLGRQSLAKSLILIWRRGLGLNGMDCMDCMLLQERDFDSVRIVVISCSCSAVVS
jgi:hypothetical protein